MIWCIFFIFLVAAGLFFQGWTRRSYERRLRILEQEVERLNEITLIKCLTYLKEKQLQQIYQKKQKYEDDMK